MYKRITEPEYLYHYTNIESLALILKNKSIRFNSLDKMDDLQEQETEDVKNIGQFFYVSSWTDDDTESIPMWNMYGSLESGIRIKLRVYPFKRYEYSKEDVLKFSKNHIIFGTEKFSSIIPLEDIFTKKFYSIYATGNNILFPVIYTNEKDKLYPHIHDTNGEQIQLSTNEIGKYKNLYWQFQNEWRYILPILPIDLNLPVAEIGREFTLMANKIAFGLEKQPVPYYELKIDDEVFQEMEIMLSPKFSDGNKTIVESLLEKYNATATIKESALKGLI